MRPSASLYYTWLSGHNSVLETGKCSHFEQCIDLLLGEQKFALKEKKRFRSSSDVFGREKIFWNLVKIGTLGKAIKRWSSVELYLIYWK